MVMDVKQEEWKLKESEKEDEDGWEYVEDGPAEIIWQGNEIIVKKAKRKVLKSNLLEVLILFLTFPTPLLCLFSRRFLVLLACSQWNGTSPNVCERAMLP